ncbi:chemotaxis protein CheA [Lentibacillus lipolyticus]|nr:chemotaxis protein CheA [Lentibacillus lipolyticus]
MDTNEYLVIFLDESNEHLQSISSNLLALEKRPANPALVDEIFRSAHTLKGMAAAMAFDDIASLTHQMENVLDRIRNGELTVTEQVIDTLMEALEGLEEMVDAVSSGGDGSKNVASLVERLGTEANPLPKEHYEQEAAAASELAKVHSNQEKTPGSKARQTTPKTIRVSSDRIDQLMNLFEELVLDRGRLQDIASELKHQELTDVTEHISSVSQDMERVLLSMRMVPVEQVFNRFPRLVRGIAKDLNKKIELDIIGAETELDRTVIDAIGDALIHLIRNSIDHGIESPKERKANGKPEAGNLTLKSYHRGNHVFIEIEDDGAGINREKVAKKAIENGLLSTDCAKNLHNEDIDQFIFDPGFSTAENVTDISGRGVGLDVVRMKIEALGGDITVESEPGKGSKFSIQLPMTLTNEAWASPR